MNKSESKYFNTAAKMDVAFLKLLEKKEIEYITVKEICEKAGVNRSTFYLHYETVSDIISECVEYITRQFFESNKTEHSEFLKKIQNCSTEELYLITPEYLIPYLSNIKQNQRLFQTMLKMHRHYGLKTATSSCFGMYSHRYWTVFRCRMKIGNT